MLVRAFNKRLRKNKVSYYFKRDAKSKPQKMKFLIGCKK